MPVIDTHCHAFNSRFGWTEAALADSLWQSSEVMGPGWTNLLRAGAFPAIEIYLDAMSSLGVDRICLVCPANTQTGSREINSLHARLIEQNPKQLVGFAAVPPLAGENGADELERAVTEYGFKGVKIYPPLHRVPLDAPSLIPIYERAARLSVPILTHCTPFPQCYTGYRFKMPASVEATATRRDDAVELDFTYDNLMRLFDSGILADFPNLTIIGAHVAGGLFSFTDYILQKNPDYRRLFSQIYVDVTPPVAYPAEMVQRAIAVLGEDHVLFGTDYPLCPIDGIREGLAAVKAYPVPEETKVKILGENAVRLLGLER